MRRGLAYLAVTAAFAFTGVWVLAQLDLTVFQSGEIISASEMNDNFQKLATALGNTQTRVTGTCDEGSSIRIVHADGTVTCELDDAGGSGGGAAVSTDDTLAGDGSAGAPLGVTVPLRLDGSSNSTATLHATNSSTGSAVRGEHGGGTVGYLGFEAYGLYGEHSNGNMGRIGSEDYGLFGRYRIFNSHGYIGSDDTGVFGQNDFTSGRGVYGYVGHATGTNWGVIGNSASTAGTGVRGIAGAPSGNTYGLFGESSSPNGYAMWGDNEATGAFGYIGGGWGAYGAHGNGDTAGVLGSDSAGVLGMGVRGAYAGEFMGDVEVEGDLIVQGTINPPSSRALKENIAAIDTTGVLQSLMGIPVSSWQYTADETGARHIGPMAEDFHAAFDVGASNDRISTIDADGVALAAIQGLYAMVVERDARISELETRLAALEQRQAAQ